ncbi:MAG: putative restriction enzyme [bacterium P3]|nr:MAG: putative restriction enzyme [bacterium P3]KWW41975.1 MAG: putative restriction enzyme [bacterium F083]
MATTEQILPTGQRTVPQIYMYDDTSFPGWIKIGQTTRSDVRKRIDEQHPVTEPHKTYRLLWYDNAFYADGSGESFSDHDLHECLRHMGKELVGEWCKCSLREAKAAYVAVRHRQTQIETVRDLDYPLRPEQKQAVTQTADYFARMDGEEPNRPSHYLWNAKMRFGKTFTTYQLAKRMNAKRVLVLTFKPAVEDSWRDDLLRHRDFDGWRYYSSRLEEQQLPSLSSSKPLVVFGSFQDYLGRDRYGNIKPKNEWVHRIEWDLIVLDEYHFGAWNDNAKSLLDMGSDEDKQRLKEADEVMRESGIDVESGRAWDDSEVPIKGKHYLYLSGTPFRALATGEFVENQIFNWTYQDEQAAKETVGGPYMEMPTMVMMTYQMPQDLGAMIEQWDMDGFDLNEFFRAETVADSKDSNGGRQATVAAFVHEKAVQKWLDIIRGKAPIFGDGSSPLNVRPALPFEDSRLLDRCAHTMWFLPNVASCDAMEALLHHPANGFYQNYTIINCSGSKAGVGVDALRPVREAMGDNPLQSRTITLTCGKLTTGVTLRPLGGLLMLRNCSSPETYFQTAFRVQSPWTATDKDDPTKKNILKTTCYVFDFAPNRALREVVTYANQLDIDCNRRITDKVDAFINFLPILQFDGSSMKRVDATEILDFVDNGTSGTLLARRWNSAQLVNVDNATLQRVLDNPEALATIMKIEGFRALGSDIIESIVNKADKIKRLKREMGDKKNSSKKKELSAVEKEYRSKRREVQEKLMKFATRIPIFMYLTDYREESLEDVIRKLEPSLFGRVTGLAIDDFDLLLRVGVFNRAQMNDAILKFRRYEDASLAYTGVNRHTSDTRIGLMDSTVPIEARLVAGKAPISRM